jgi:hypothetical protein
VSTTLFGVVSGFCSFIQFGVYLSFFIVTVTAVRSRRPDAWSPLAAGAATLLVDFILRMTLNITLPVLMARATSGMSAFYGMQAMINVVGTIVSVIGWTLMIIGVVRLASEPA